MNMAFDLTVAPGLFEGSDNGLVVPLNARCKPAELRDVGPLGTTQPIVEASCASRNNELLAEFMRQDLSCSGLRTGLGNCPSPTFLLLRTFGIRLCKPERESAWRRRLLTRLRAIAFSPAPKEIPQCARLTAVALLLDLAVKL